MDAKHERFARNEALFREANERIEEVSRRHEIGDNLEFLCECGRRDCLETIALARAEYEAVRREGDRFFVAPGHELPEVERVVERHERYFVVEKLGQAGELAEAQDPRA
jgi:predicted NBD/HSP70 family sugar kinase